MVYGKITRTTRRDDTSEDCRKPNAQPRRVFARPSMKWTTRPAAIAADAVFSSLAVFRHSSPYHLSFGLIYWANQLKTGGDQPVGGGAWVHTSQAVRDQSQGLNETFKTVRVHWHDPHFPFHGIGVLNSRWPPRKAERAGRETERERRVLGRLWWLAAWLLAPLVCRPTHTHTPDLFNH